MKTFVKTLITFGVGAVCAVLILWGNGAYTETVTTELMKKLSDAFFVPGVVILGFGLLTVASNGGAFDMLAYGVRSFVNFFRRDPTKRKYKDFYEYRNSKKDKKLNANFLILGGIAHIVIAVVFFVCYYNV